MKLIAIICAGMIASAAFATPAAAQPDRQARHSYGPGYGHHGPGMNRPGRPGHHWGHSRRRACRWVWHRNHKVRRCWWR